MANMTKANLMDDLAAIKNKSGSEGGFLVNAVNYVWDLWVTIAGTTPTTAQEATAQGDIYSNTTFPGGNADYSEKLRI